MGWWSVIAFLFYREIRNCSLVSFVRNQTVALGSRFLVGSPYLIAERSHPNMNLTPEAKEISRSHAVRLKNLCLNKAIKQNTTNAENTKSAMPSPMIQRIRIMFIPR